MNKNKIKTLWTKAEIIKAVFNKNQNNRNFQITNKITGVSIDSRTINPGDLFIALNGINHDGNLFIPEAIKKGASGIITTNLLISKKFRGLFVEDTMIAFQKLAIFSRARFKGKIIAITGSNGKTSTKNMLASSLAHFGKTHSTDKNNNNMIGLCLTLCRLLKNNDYCVLELGMNNRNELKKLSNIAKPNLALITNISQSHIGNFSSEREIAQEKSEIFSGLEKNGYVILNADDKWYEFLLKRAVNYSKNIYSFGTNPNSYLRIKNIVSKNFGTKFKVEQQDFFLKYLHKYNALNVSSILLVLKLFKLNYGRIKAQILNFKPSRGRGDYIKLKLNKNDEAIIINDSYNANPSSMTYALENILHIKNKWKSIVIIIGDMLELGKNEKKYHTELLPIIEKINPRILITVGNISKIIFTSLKKKICCFHFKNTDKLNREFLKMVKPKDIILIKGSNSTGLFQFTNKFYSK